jgi:hypothetical protein
MILKTLTSPPLSTVPDQFAEAADDGVAASAIVGALFAVADNPLRVIQRGSDNPQ